MEEISIYVSNHKAVSPSEITLGQIFDYEIVIIDGSIFRSTDTLDSLGNGDLMTLFDVSDIKLYDHRYLYELRDDFSQVIKDARENEQIVILLEEGTDTKFPYICANGLQNRKIFWDTVKILNELISQPD